MKALKCAWEKVREAAFWSKFGSSDKARIDRDLYRQKMIEKQPIIQKTTWNFDDSLTEMCLLGLDYPSDKSPIAIDSYCRHAYTPVYNLLFAPYKNRQINFAEIGVLYGASLQMFREFFTRATLRGFECDKEMREKAEALKLNDTQIHFVDVRQEDSIKESFEKTGLEYDIIIDDSSHEVSDQIRIIRGCVPFLKPGGMLIVEDIYDNIKAPEALFEDVVQELSDELAYSTFIFPKSKRIFDAGWDNQKILLLVKN